VIMCCGAKSWNEHLLAMKSRMICGRGLVRPKAFLLPLPSRHSSAA
jgi:hypothetical protein